MDLLAMLAVSLFALPVAIVVALVVRFQMGSPVFFRQVRPGYKAKPFTLLKFRTMNSASDERGNCELFLFRWIANSWELHA